MASQPPYIDSCILLSLFLGDSGFEAAEAWLTSQGSDPLWISHWVLLECAGVLSLCTRRGDLDARRSATIQREFERFRHERLSLIEPRGVDFLQARQWLLGETEEQTSAFQLRGADALHLAIALRNGMNLVTADSDLATEAERLGLPFTWVASGC